MSKRSKKKHFAEVPATAEPVCQATHEDFPMNTIIKFKGEVRRHRVVAHSDNGVYLSLCLAGLIDGRVTYHTLSELKRPEEISVRL